MFYLFTTEKKNWLFFFLWNRFYLFDDKIKLTSISNKGRILAFFLFNLKVKKSREKKIKNSLKTHRVPNSNKLRINSKKDFWSHSRHIKKMKFLNWNRYTCRRLRLSVGRSSIMYKKKFFFLMFSFSLYKLCCIKLRLYLRTHYKVVDKFHECKNMKRKKKYIIRNNEQTEK